MSDVQAGCFGAFKLPGRRRSRPQCGICRNTGTRRRDRAGPHFRRELQFLSAGVRAGEWRILVGDDAHALDADVRADPEGIYRSGRALFASP